MASIIPCSLGRFLNGLPESDRGNLQKWLDADFVSHASLVQQIAAEAGQVFGKDTVSAHRGGRCRCSKI